MTPELVSAADVLADDELFDVEEAVFVAGVEDAVTVDAAGSRCCCCGGERGCSCLTLFGERWHREARKRLNLTHGVVDQQVSAVAADIELFADGDGDNGEIVDLVGSGKHLRLQDVDTPNVIRNHTV